MNPFFVVGCGRSGTTLLRVILNRHSRLAIPLESLFIPDYLKATGSVPIQTMRELIAQEYELREWGLEVAPPDLADCGDAAALIERLHCIYAEQNGKERWGQKTPRLVRYWALIRSAFPQAKFIHVVRDPRAVAASLVRSDVHRSTHFHAARRWAGDVKRGVEMEKALGEDAIRVLYENLVSNPEGEIRRICELLEVDYQPEILHPRDRGIRDYGTYYSNIHELVRKPITADRTDAWRSELSAEQIRIIEGVVKPLMPEMGYQEVFAGARNTRSDSIRATITRVVRLPGLVRHYSAFRRGYLRGVLKRKRVLGLLAFRDLQYWNG